MIPAVRALFKHALQRWTAVLLAVLVLLVGGTWATIKLTVDYLLYEDATTNARAWANYLAANVADLEQIAAGEMPSAASMAFFRATRKAGQVFRYVIFNRDGYSQLISDRNGVMQVDLSELSDDALHAIKTGASFVDFRKASGNDLPAYYATAYVVARVGRRPVAIVAAYVDETEQRDMFYWSFLSAALALGLVTGMSFALPAMAWRRRSREKQQADRHIRFLAHHDAHTGLLNRARFIETIESALLLPPASRRSFAIHFVDVDHFKNVNDTLGHDGGDFVLETVAKRLLAATAAGDVVGRFGGDEFVVAQFDISGEREAREFAERMLSQLNAPILFRDQEIAVTVSIGVATFPADGATLSRLLKCADLAAYAAKASGRNCARAFTPDMDASMQERVALERQIRDAVLHDRFELHYQPVFKNGGRRLAGFEALLRLPAVGGRRTPPDVFIPIAEQMHLIHKIGAWVLHEACRTAAKWPKHLAIAVNLSPTQFPSGHLGAVVADALRASGLQARQLELEITETVLLGNTDETMAELRKLKAMGVAIVMDDFGVGYSNISCLWQFPFDKIKLDRVFLKGFDRRGGNARAIVKSMIALGRELHMCVTAEGVETAEQAHFLAEIDVDQMQGFYLGRPVPAVEVANIILADIKRDDPRPAVAAEPKMRLVK